MRLCIFIAARFRSNADDGAAGPRTLVDADRGGREKEVDGEGGDKAKSHAEKEKEEEKEESMITVFLEDTRLIREYVW